MTCTMEVLVSLTQARRQGVCGGVTPPLACFSREIGNFSRQNGEATPRSTCITFGPQALIKITCKIKKRSFETSQ